MPFVTVPGPHYIKRTLLFIDSEDREPTLSQDGYRFGFKLPEEIQEVIGIELVQFNIVKSLVPTFFGRIDMPATRESNTFVSGIQGSNMVTDVLIEDGLAELKFAVSLDPASFYVGATQRDYPLAGETLDSTQILLWFYICFCFQWFGSTHPILNSTNFDLLLGGDIKNDKFVLYLENIAFPGTYASVTFLYGTGPNAGDQMSQVLGFPRNKDTSPSINTFMGAASTSSIVSRPFAYVDVLCHETQEFDPLARIYLLGEFDGYNTPCDIPHQLRIIKNPVRSMRNIHLDVRLPGNLIPQSADEIGFQLTVEIYSIMQIPKLPEWMVQRLTV